MNIEERMADKIEAATRKENFHRRVKAVSDYNSPDYRDALQNMWYYMGTRHALENAVIEMRIR